MSNEIGGCWNCDFSDFGDSDRNKPAPPAKIGVCKMAELKKYARKNGKMTLISSDRLPFGVNSHSACTVFSKIDDDQFDIAFEARTPVQDFEEEDQILGRGFNDFDHERAKHMVRIGLIYSGSHIYTDHVNQNNVHLPQESVAAKKRAKVFYSNLFENQ